jgi:universal stress protein A
MALFEKILCPVDFSEPSLKALQAAVELAGNFSAELAVLHVVSPLPAIPGASTPTGFHFPTVMQEIEASAQTAIEDLARERVPDEVAVNPMVVQGMPAEEIVRMAQVSNVDIIVIATHGLTGWSRFLFGSVAEKVVRTAPCYVMTVPAPLKEEEA